MTGRLERLWILLGGLAGLGGVAMAAAAAHAGMLNCVQGRYRKYMIVAARMAPIDPAATNGPAPRQNAATAGSVRSPPRQNWPTISMAQPPHSGIIASTRKGS